MQPTPEESAKGGAPLRRILPLSGVAFAALFLIGWFASGGDAPDHTAPDQAWATWAEDNQWRSRIGAFAMLLAGFVFLHFAAEGLLEIPVDLLCYAHFVVHVAIVGFDHRFCENRNSIFTRGALR